MLNKKKFLSSRSLERKSDKKQFLMYLTSIGPIEISYKIVHLFAQSWNEFKPPLSRFASLSFSSLFHLWRPPSFSSFLQWINPIFFFLIFFNLQCVIIVIIIIGAKLCTILSEMKWWERSWMKREATRSGWLMIHGFTSYLSPFVSFSSSIPIFSQEMQRLSFVGGIAQSVIVKTSEHVMSFSIPLRLSLEIFRFLFSK